MKKQYWIGFIILFIFHHDDHAELLHDYEMGFTPPCEIPGYTFGGNYNGHSYYISESFTSWTEAKALAESIGGHLATISDANENAFVVGIVDFTCFLDYAWIGLSDEDVEGTFVWVTGEPLIYTNWAPGNPGGSQQDYTEIYSSFYGGTWGDYESPPRCGLLHCGVRIPDLRLQ